MSATRQAGADPRPIIILKRTKKVVGGHHGGAWKVAYADFVTALMAFFLVMWLVATVSNEQRAAIFDYFKNPSMEPGKSSTPAPGQMGPGGASTSPIDLQGGMDAPKFSSTSIAGLGAPMQPVAFDPQQQPGQPAGQSKLQDDRAAEREKLESLMEDLRKAIAESQALAPFKDQLLIDLSPEGLRIQIVDAQNRPMFDTGSAQLRDYTRNILHEVASYLNTVPNRISLAGHTDIRSYVGRRGYSNWELSTERANAARRALEEGGLGENKTMRVVGLASLVPFDRDHPEDAINRRISIVVMTQEAEEQALRGSAPLQARIEDPLPQEPPVEADLALISAVPVAPDEIG